MSGDKRGRRRSKGAAATHDDIEGGGSNTGASSVNPEHVKIRGLSPEEYLSAWRDKTGIPHLTEEQVWDHQLRLQSCFRAILDDPTISKQHYRHMYSTAEAISYQILCNGGTSDNWPYPIQKKKKY